MPGQDDIFTVLSSTFPNKIIDVPVDQMIRPGLDLGVRDIKEKHVSDLIATFSMFVNRTQGVCSGVIFESDLNELDRQALIGDSHQTGNQRINWDHIKIGRFKVEIVAGAHRSEALHRLHAANLDDPRYKTWPVQVFVVPNRSRAKQYFVQLGVAENALSAKTLTMNRFDFIQMMRNRILEEEMKQNHRFIASTAEEAEDPVFKSQAARLIIKDIKEEAVLLKKTYNPTLNPTVKTIDPDFQIARYSSDCWELLKKIVTAAKTDSEQSKILGKQKEIQGLDFVTRRMLLEKVSRGEITFMEMETEASTLKNVVVLQNEAFKIVNKALGIKNKPSFKTVNEFLSDDWYKKIFTKDFFADRAKSDVVKGGVVVSRFSSDVLKLVSTVIIELLV